MKKAAQLLPMAMLALALASCGAGDSTNNDNQKNETLAMTTPCKRPIDYTPLVLTSTNRTTMGSDIAPNVRYEHNGTIHPYNFGSTELTFDELNTIRNNVDSNCTTWPGIKVYYGLDADADKFIYIFQPVNLELYDTAGAVDNFNITDKGLDKYYYKDAGGNLVEVTYNDIADYIDNYKTKTRLHNASTGMDDVIDTTQHPYAITFPFDELYTLISQNEKLLFDKMNKDNQVHTMDEIKTKFATKGILFECGSKATGNYQYHHIMLTPLYVNATPSTPGTLTFNSADLGALCPPNCGQTGIAVVSTEKIDDNDSK